MKAETATAAATSAASAAFAAGITWLAVAFAFIAAAAGLHFDDEGRPSGFLRMLLAVAAVAAFALCLALLAHFLLEKSPPLFGYLSLGNVPIEGWAALFGFFGKPIYRRLRIEADRRNAPGG